MPGERVIAWHQKLGVALLVTIGLATFVLGIVRIKGAVDKPFLRKTNLTFKSAEQIEAEREAALKAADTDKDELSDYDELYVFRTSPFLEDTDSDGAADGQEVAANSDPNCPKGRTCRQVSSASAAEGGATSDSGTEGTTAPTGSKEEQAYQAILDTFGDPTKLTAADISARVEAMTSSELRGFLTSLGVPVSALEKADDATLKKLLAETLIEIAAGSPAATQ